MEHRIDELARLAGTTVRNVRAYQDRGLLPAPRRQGRVALYSDAHLVRLRLIGALLERGYTLANIAELLVASERGQDVGALLGLGEVPGAARPDGAPRTVDVAELRDLLGGSPLDDDAVARAADVGLVEPDGPAHYRVLNPSALEVGALLLRAGVPLAAVLDAAARLRRDLGDVADQFVTLVEEHVVGPPGEPLPSAEVPRLASVVARLRPLAQQAVTTELARAMDQRVHRRLGGHLASCARGVEEAS